MAEKKKAICVGINNFKNYPASALQGCVNDCHDMAAMLKTFQGFDENDISIFQDEQATKDRIMRDLKLMVKDAGEGKYNYLVFSLSSHGTQVPDTSGDEPDHADEAFCTHDLIQKGDRWDPEHIITDDELAEVFSAVPKNVLLEVYLDTCHSGTGLRVIDLIIDRKPRFIPPPTIQAYRDVSGLRTHGLHEALLANGMRNHILWAACRSDQTSADAKIQGGWHGAFTYFLNKQIQATKNALSRKELLQRVKKDLGSEYSQIPQLESSSPIGKLPMGPGAARAPA